MFITFHSAKFGKRKSADTTGFTLTNEQFDRLFETRSKRTRDVDDDGEVGEDGEGLTQ